MISQRRYLTSGSKRRRTNLHFGEKTKFLRDFSPLRSSLSPRSDGRAKRRSVATEGVRPMQSTWFQRRDATDLRHKYFGTLRKLARLHVSPRCATTRGLDSASDISTAISISSSGFSSDFSDVTTPALWNFLCPKAENSHMKRDLGLVVEQLASSRSSFGAKRLASTNRSAECRSGEQETVFWSVLKYFFGFFSWLQMRGCFHEDRWCSQRLEFSIARSCLISQFTIALLSMVPRQLWICSSICRYIPVCWGLLSYSAFQSNPPKSFLNSNSNMMQLCKEVSYF